MLENNKADFKELASAYGYTTIKPEKNPFMFSFKKEEDPNARINVYYTTMTVTVQYKDGQKMKSFREVDIDTFEEILQKENL